MSTSKASFAPAADALVISGPIANGAYRQAAKFDNRVKRYLDSLLEFGVTTVAAPSGSKRITVYAAVAIDDALVWPDEISGADAAYTPGDIRNLIRVGAFYGYGGAGDTFSVTWPTAMGPLASLFMSPYITFVLLNEMGVEVTNPTIRLRGGQISEE